MIPRTIFHWTENKDISDYNNGILSIADLHVGDAAGCSGTPRTLSNKDDGEGWSDKNIAG